MGAVSAGDTSLPEGVAGVMRKRAGLWRNVQWDALQGGTNLTFF